ncbi:unnamed protein product [Rotaria sordida]|uniref:Uncharacterized protein n=1 Tax=Rotaria sordida TaxID=392033 RepID=A0A815W116_9BILA|nr:unnamed protein product [Rotaria sordida]CAF1537239.1 unnamed protein product [Rotaria sordida]
MNHTDDNSSPLCTPSPPVLHLNNVYSGQSSISPQFNIDTNLDKKQDIAPLMASIENLKQLIAIPLASFSEREKNDEKIMEKLQKQEQMIAILLASFSERAKNDEKIMEKLQKQEQMIKSLMKKSPLSLQSNISNNATAQQQTELMSTINGSQLSLVANEISTITTTNSGISEEQRILEDIQNGNFMKNNQHEEIRTHATYVTTNELYFNNQSSTKPDEIDRIRYQKSQKKAKTGKECNEVSNKIADQTSGSMSNTDNENQRQIKLKSKNSQHKSSSISVDYQLLHQVVGTNNNSSTTNLLNEPVAVHLRHPIKTKFEEMTKVRRPVSLTDDFNNPLELIVSSGRLPSGNVDMDLSMVSQSQDGNHFSPYSLSTKNDGTYSDILSVKCKIPERFHCTLGTGHQRLKISLIDGFYIIENNQMTEFCYVNCKEESFETCFEIVKRDECLIGPIHCSVEIQPLYCEDSSISSPITYYPDLW